MKRSQQSFGRLSLDLGNECARQGDRALRLTPKAFAVLRYLMERSGRLATKEELFSAVWPDTSVTDASLSTCIREIRRVLKDRAKNPRYIETVHKRGYRYIGASAESALTVEPSCTETHLGILVGRDRELSVLNQALRDVERGEMRLIFVSGEAGIGKTTLVEHFMARIGTTTARTTRGQCVEQQGASEAYMPWLEALNNVARWYGKHRLTALLYRYAPMWLAQLPWLVKAREREQLQREIAGATSERMIRELAETIGVLSADEPLVLVLEDLHWSDPSSIKLLGYLARRRQRSRLLLIGTCRPMELHIGSNPLIDLKRELLLHDSCWELHLDFLAPNAVAEYVASQFSGAPDDLAIRLHKWTDGSPLFLINVIDYLVRRGALVQEHGQWNVKGTLQSEEMGVPATLTKMIERQIDSLPGDDRRVLEAASVAGNEFNEVYVASILGELDEFVEEKLASLARRNCLIRRTVRQIWPDGTQSDGFRFIHVLYENVLYDRIGTARRVRMHGRAGERLETGYRGHVEEIAVELSRHFECARDWTRAVCYLLRAGEAAMRCSAYEEAITLLNRGLALLVHYPEGTERDVSEIQFRVALGVSYMNTRGYAATEVGNAFGRAHKLCRHVSKPAHLFRVLRGVWIFAEQRAELRKALPVAEELLHIAERLGDVAGLVEGHRILATTWFHLGNFHSAFDHVQQGLSMYDPKRHSSHAYLYGQDPGVCGFAWQAWIQWYLGYPDRALTSTTQSIELARQINHPFSLSYALNFAAYLHLRRREPDAVETFARESVRCAEKHGLPSMLAVGQILHGWSSTFLEGTDAAIDELANGLARWRSTGSRLMTPYWMCLLASALLHVGRMAAAGEVLDNALTEMDGTEERWFESDLYILKARLALPETYGKSRRSPHGEAQRDLRRALHAATRIGSPSLRLCAASALSPLLREHGKTHEARDLLGTAYAAFSEGLQTADLVDARALLATL